VNVPPTVTFHPDAARELQGAYDWYIRRTDSGARALALEVDIAIERMAAAPNRWPILAGNIRRYLLKRFPFAVIYRIEHEEIQVIAVAHSRRRPGYWMAR
jgi:toxin ParE1/3/4